MDTPMPNIMFRGMSTIFKIRDWLSPRQQILHEVGIRPGYKVLDFGCGPGAYIPTTAQLVGETGLVYALDLHPLAIQSVRRLAQKQKLCNIKTIQSDGPTQLPAGSVDVVLLYDIFHMLSQPDAVLAELQRILRPNGRLSVIEPHWPELKTINGITRAGRFKLVKEGKYTLSFAPHTQTDGTHR